MKQSLLPFLILFTKYSCSDNPTSKNEKDGEPSIYSVTDDDTEMNEAILKANQSIDKFNEALLSSNPDYEYFALKTRFVTRKGGEHICVSNIIIKENNYYGILDNLPESITNMEIGDTIQIKKENISDWMYINHKKLCGGYTVRLLRKRMTELERKQFDHDNGIIIED